MRYLGGKFRLAKRIVPLMDIDGRDVWEPFVGGANVTPHLAARARSVWCTDAHPALIAMYQALMNGWDPPTSVSEEEYRSAMDLPDSDPLKAFVGFGCSFGGKWFGGYAKPYDPPRGPNASICGGAAKSLRALRSAANGVTFSRVNFLDTAPLPGPSSDMSIYCDPPYASTTDYSTGTFNHGAFWARCQEWARSGALVYVSEYKCPVPHELLYQAEHPRGLRTTSDKPKPVECLFRVLP